MVGAPTGALDVASFLVCVPAVGVERGLVAAPRGVSGLVAARTVDASGIVGAPVANGALAGAPTGGARGMVGVRGAEVLRGIAGAGAVLAVTTSGGVSAKNGTGAGLAIGGTMACTGTSGLGVGVGTNRTGELAFAGGREAAGTAGGASDALSVTRTVSFFKGTLEVILEAGSLSFSLMQRSFCNY